MTELLEKAFTEAAKLPDEDQDSLANWIMNLLASEQLWDKAFAKSADKLSQLANEALAHYRAGLTEELDPDKL